MSQTQENVPEGDPLSFEEVERIHAETASLDAAGSKPTAAPNPTAAPRPTGKGMSESDVNDILNSIGDGDDDGSYGFAPSWQTGNGDEGDSTSLSEQVSAVKKLAEDIETSIGTLDDTSTDIRARLEEVQTEVAGTRSDVVAMADDVAGVKSQLVGLQQEFETLRLHVSSMIRILTTSPVLKQLGIDTKDDAAGLATRAVRPKAPQPKAESSAAVAPGPPKPAVKTKPTVSDQRAKVNPSFSALMVS